MPEHTVFHKGFVKYLVTDYTVTCWDFGQWSCAVVGWVASVFKELAVSVFRASD
jgi:hypothetical protein